MHTFDNLKETNRLLYHYIAGSHLYNLNTEDSDVDTKGIFICDMDDVLGIGLNYQELVKDSKNDNVAYEIGKFMGLLRSSNPTVLEALFVPQGKMIVKPHPILQPMFENKNEFLTRKCFGAFTGYAYQQIEKARGLNKKMMNPIEERLTPFDFAYTFYGQGSTKVKDWLDNRGLDKDCCGLVHIPNMHDTYGVYYDWGAHFERHGIHNHMQLVVDIANKDKCTDKQPYLFADFIAKTFNISTIDELKEWFDDNVHVNGYRGMCLEASNEMRLTSVSKGEKPICYMVYNESGYQAHCKYYKEYQDWVKNRNPKRYESNLGHNYDSKNMMHCMRLMHMGVEIAKGEGMNLERTWDKELLLDIRMHKYEYEDVLAMAVKAKEELDAAIATSTLKKDIDPILVNDLLIDIRKNYAKIS